MVKPLSDEDVAPLRQACSIAFQELTELLKDRRLSLDAHTQILKERNQIEKAWSKIPDHFDPQEGGHL